MSTNTRIFFLRTYGFRNHQDDLVLFIVCFADREDQEVLVNNEVGRAESEKANLEQSVSCHGFIFKNNTGFGDYSGA